MGYGLPPHPAGEGEPVPVFLDTSGFGVVPNYAPPGTPLRGEWQGPVDPLRGLLDELDAIEFQVQAGHRAGAFSPAGIRLVNRLNAAIEAVRALLIAEPQVLRDCSVTRLPDGVMLAMADVLPAIGPAKRAVMRLMKWRSTRHITRPLPDPVAAYAIPAR